MHTALPFGFERFRQARLHTHWVDCENQGFESACVHLVHCPVQVEELEREVNEARLEAKKAVAEAKREAAEAVSK